MRPVLVLLTLLLAAAVAPFPGAPARASCVGPQLAIAGQRVPAPAVRPASVVTVEGRYFVDGCDDTGSQTAGFGCTHQSRPGEPVTSMSDVELVLRQRGREWPLGTGDATTRGRMSWDVRIPAGLRPGRARLVAATSQTVVVVVPRR